MELQGYIDFLRSEITEREETLTKIAKYTQLPAGLDPNCRLEQGYIYAIAKVYKDLCEISGREEEKGFYPDMFGFLNDD